MTAAIYARRSTDQSGVSDEQKSVARQAEHGRAYAARKGWTVLDAHVYVDHGISGAEFANRPGFLRLMNALKPRAPFQVLVMSEESRLGRESIETAYALKQLVQAGVRVFFYMEDRERTLDSPTDKIMLSLTTFADELEREKARQRTYDAMQRKARAGHVTGGACFGYDNVETVGSDGQRSHVERRINDAEAAVVRRIFELCASGAGLTRITKQLNAEAAPAPRPQQGRPAAWAPSSVRDVLLRPLYRGEIVWNVSRKRDRWGQSKRSERPAADWLHVPAPGLQIVSADLWQAAHRELQGRRQQFAQAGRQRHDGESKYLLTNFGRCGCCGGSFAVQTRRHGSQRVALYGCATAAKRGTTVCANTLVARMEILDREVLATLESDVLRPTVVEQAIELALEDLAPTGQQRTRDRLAVEVSSLENECERLARAMSRGGRVDALLGVLEQHQGRLAAARRELANMNGLSLSVDRRGLEGRLRAKLRDWRQLLTADIASGRAVLRLLLEGPIRFTPIVEERRRGYAFEGAIAFDRLLAGVVEFPPCLASPTGHARFLKTNLVLDVSAA